MTNNNDWTELLRQKLTDHTEAVPDGVWEAVERRVSAPARTVQLRRVLTAAAAVLVIAVGGGIVVWQAGRHHQGTDVQAVATVAAHKDQSPAGTLLAEAVPTPSPATPAEDGTARRPSASSPVSAVPALPGAAVEPASAASTPADADAPQPVEPGSAQPDEPVAPPAHTDEHPAGHGTATPPSGNIHLRGRNGRTGAGALHLDFSLLASNVGSTPVTNGSTTVEPMRMSRAMVASFAGTDAAPHLLLSQYSEETDHRPPVTVGLSARLRVLPRWWVETGVMATRLTSTFVHQTPVETLRDEQQLSYVGVPLGVGFDVWGNSYLHTYLSASAQADFCVRSRMESEGRSRHFTHDRTQFSVGAHAGVELQLLPVVGFYVQPGLRYYPDNGSQLENFFKDRPLTLDLQLGLRIDMGRK